MKITKKQTQDYDKSLSTLIKKIDESRNKAITTANKLLVNLYWSIGMTISDLQENGKWGDGVVKKLSQDLRMKYPNQKGFSVQNLWYMKNFYITYYETPKLQTVSGVLSWSNNVLILNKTKTIEEKEFYLKMCLKERWSFRELQRQIDSAYFERFMLSKEPEELVKIEQEKFISVDDAHQHLKDENILEFLGLSETFSEKELRKAILDNLRDFFLEFGKNLSFVGEEYPVVVDNETFRIDLLFFHRELNCLVAVELKIGEFKPEYVGKMQFYLAALDEQIKLPHEKPTIGMILCRSKKDNVVRLTLGNNSKGMKVSAYQTKLPDKKLIEQRLEKMKLPTNL